MLDGRWFVSLCYNNKQFLCIAHTVEHIYISPSSTVGYTTARFGPVCWPSSGCDLTYTAAIQDVWGSSFRVLGIGWGEQDLIVSIVGTMT